MNLEILNRKDDVFKLESSIKTVDEKVASLTKSNLQAHKSVSQLSINFDSLESSSAEKVYKLGENLKTQHSSDIVNLQVDLHSKVNQMQHIIDCEVIKRKRLEDSVRN